jgi:hypothetical protein
MLTILASGAAAEMYLTFERLPAVHSVAGLGRAVAELGHAVQVVAGWRAMLEVEAGRAAPTKLDLYHRAVEDGHLPSPP